MAKVTITGRDELFRQLRALVPEIEAEVQPAIDQCAAEMVGMARALAPVDEGELRASIKATSAGQSTPLYSGGGRQKVGELSARVTAGDYVVRYASIVEFGRKATAKHGAMAARPFFWPAYRSLRKRFRGRITRAINKALKKAAT